MAETPRPQQIIDALCARLATILTINGYHTNVGLKVQKERVEQGIPTAPRVTVAITSKVREPDKPKNERLLSGVIEVEVPASYTNAMAHLLQADDDIDVALDAYLQMPTALPIAYAETVFLDRPEGLPVVVAQVMWTTRYRR
jgi:hypothetical protein